MGPTERRELETWLSLPPGHLDDKAQRRALASSYGLNTNQLFLLHRALDPKRREQTRKALAWLGLEDTIANRIHAHRHLRQHPDLEEIWRLAPPEAWGNPRLTRMLEELIRWGHQGPWADARALEQEYQEGLAAWGLDEAGWAEWRARGYRRPADTAFVRGLPPPPPPPPFHFPLPEPVDLEGLRFHSTSPDPGLLTLLSRWAKHPLLSPEGRRVLYAIKTHFLREGLQAGRYRATRILHREELRPLVDADDVYESVQERMEFQLGLVRDGHHTPDEHTWRILAALGTREMPEEKKLRSFLEEVLKTWNETTLGQVPAYFSYGEVSYDYDRDLEEVFQHPWLWGRLDPRRADLVEVTLENGAVLHTPWRQVGDLLSTPLPQEPGEVNYGRPPTEEEEREWPLERLLAALGVEVVRPVDWWRPPPRSYWWEDEWEDEDMP